MSDISRFIKFYFFLHILTDGINVLYIFSSNLYKINYEEFKDTKGIIQIRINKWGSVNIEIVAQWLFMYKIEFILYKLEEKM
jgi:hypothetical protein